LARNIASGDVVDGALGEIELLVVDLCLEPSAFLVIGTSKDSDVFVQAAVTPSCPDVILGAAACARCGPNCTPCHLLSPVERLALVRLGWRLPVLDPLVLAATPEEGEQRTFSRRVPLDWGWPPAMVAELWVRTLAEVWGLQPAECLRRLSRLAPDRVPVPA